MGADAALISSFEKLATAGKRDYSRQLQLQKEGGDILREGIMGTAETIAGGIQAKKEAELKAQNDAQKELNRKRNVEKNHFDKLFKKEML